MNKEQIKQLIIQQAQANGLDPATMLAIADIESKFVAGAKNPSGAEGVYQFLPKTAAGYGLSNPSDAKSNVSAGMRFTRDNIAYFKKTLGRDPTPGEIYLMHQQGMGGATKLMRNPNALAADVVGNKAVTQNGGWAGMTAGQFGGLWMNKMDKTYQSYGGAASQPNQMGAMGIRPDGSIGPLDTPNTGPDVTVAGMVNGDTTLAGRPRGQRRAASFAEIEALRSIANASPFAKGGGITKGLINQPGLIDQSSTLQSGVMPLNLNGIIG